MGTSGLAESPGIRGRRGPPTVSPYGSRPPLSAPDARWFCERKHIPKFCRCPVSTSHENPTPTMQFSQILKHNTRARAPIRAGAVVALQHALKPKRTQPPTAHYDATTAHYAVLIPKHPYHVGTSDTKNYSSHRIPARPGDLWATQRHLAEGGREGGVDREGATLGTPAAPLCQVFLLAQRSPTLTQAECGFQGTQKHAGIERGALYQRNGTSTGRPACSGDTERRWIHPRCREPHAS